MEGGLNVARSGQAEGVSRSGTTQDWTKFVTLNPPNAVAFKENKDEGKGVSWIEIINKSQEHIIFKVNFGL